MPSVVAACLLVAGRSIFLDGPSPHAFQLFVAPWMVLLAVSRSVYSSLCPALLAPTENLMAVRDIRDGQ